MSDELIGLVDLAPTFAGLAGVDGLPDDNGPPRGGGSSDRREPATGRDFLDLIYGDATSREAVPLLNHAAGWQGVRTPRYTYAKTDPDLFPHLVDGAWLLFDTEADRHQLRNLLYDPDHAEARAECEQLVEAFL